MNKPMVAIALVAAAALVGGCGGAGDVATTTGTSTTSPAAASARTAPSTPDRSAPAGTGRSLRVRVVDGRVSGDVRSSVARGTTVTLRVLVDTDDEVHVHGYDREFPVRAGVESSITFTADIPGRFEVETHEGGLRLMELTVT